MISELRKRIIKEAESWIGTPWQHQARIKPNDNFKGAVDCVGLIICIHNHFNKSELDYTNYARLPKNDDLLHIFHKHMSKVDYGQEQSGDVAVMNIGRDPQHAAILTDRSTIIHACADAQKVLEVPFSEALRIRTRGFFKFIWVDE